jgi:type II restriction/modification system DNA methylase subunit YeeA
MTPSEFAAKWSAATVKESAGSKEHFIDLCRMLGYPTPTQADPTGEWYAFEKGAEKTEGGDGFADVWKRGHFGWEYKGKKKDLGAAYKQLLDYREALENPPLLVVSDMDRFEVHTNFTNTAKQIYRFDLADLATDPKEPLRILRRLIDATQNDPVAFAGGLSGLFGKMSDGGGLFGTDKIEWFNGGLFDGPAVVELTIDEIKTLLAVSKLDWSQVEPAIFGTLFERGLDPGKRSQLGAHYTDRASIERLVEPVVIAPLRREFEAMKARVLEIGPHRYFPPNTKPENHPVKVFQAFLARLRSVTVLDPACGSGNFLYIALQALKDVEREAIIWGSQALKRPMQYAEIGPEAVKGIEINLYAAEIARVVIWIGEIQWMLNNGFAYRRNPILRPLENIECRDAVLAIDENGVVEAQWPDATFIVGNPPFIGGKLLRSNLGDEYVDDLFCVYQGRVPREADLVTYWHEKARAMIEADRVERVGLLATQGIRGGANRRVLERVKGSGDIFMAWSDEPWILEGAMVHVSFVAYDNGSETSRALNGQAVQTINANLTAGSDLSRARPLIANAGVAFMGDTKGGPFDIPEPVAAEMLSAPNPDGRSNADVVKPWINGLDVGGRPRGWYIIDFGTDMPAQDAAKYEAPFEYVKEHVKPGRQANRRLAYAERWWIHVEPRSGMRKALAGLPRYLVTVRHSKHRLFVWVAAGTLPDSALIAFARDDDYTFGVLHSRVHELWARGQGTQVREVESGFRYTPTSTYETFPMPTATAEQQGAIAVAAANLDRLRSGWLNPDGLKPEKLELRTLTKLYNERPTWLDDAHRAIDVAVLHAYGWPVDASDEEVVAGLLDLNLART